MSKDLPVSSFSTSSPIPTLNVLPFPWCFRRTFCNQILQIIKDEGAFSTMHTFLVYLQMAPMRQQPSLATLLLQLDLLVCFDSLTSFTYFNRKTWISNHGFYGLNFQAEPRKMSIYREEAVEALIEALHRKDFSNSQMMALDALVSISARRTSSGGTYMEAWLLKIAGYDLPYNALMKAEKLKKNENDLAENFLAETMVCGFCLSLIWNMEPCSIKFCDDSEPWMILCRKMKRKQ